MPIHGFPPLNDSQIISGAPQVAHPGVVTTPFPPVGPMPIYDIRHQGNAALATTETRQPPPPSRKSKVVFFVDFRLKTYQRLHCFRSIEEA